MENFYLRDFNLKQALFYSSLLVLKQILYFTLLSILKSIKENIVKVKTLVGNQSFDKALSELKKIQLTAEEKKEFSIVEKKFKTVKKEDQSASKRTDNSLIINDLNRFIEQIIKNRAKSFISKSHLNKAFDILKLLNLTNRQENKLVLYESRLNRIQSNFIDGLISSENRDVKITRVIDALLVFIKDEVFFQKSNKRLSARFSFFVYLTVGLAILYFLSPLTCYQSKSTKIVTGKLENCNQDTRLWTKINGIRIDIELDSNNRFKLEVPSKVMELDIFYGECHPVFYKLVKKSTHRKLPGGKCCI